MSKDILAELAELARQRQNDSPENSYIARLLQGNEDDLLKKIVEEAAEASLAARAGDRDKFKEELADLWFHCIVAMTRYNVSMEDVTEILRARRGMSGIEEKKARGRK